MRPLRGAESERIAEITPISLRLLEDGGAVITDGATDNNRVSRLDALHGKGCRVLDEADAGGVDEEAVGGPPGDDLGVSRHDGDAGLLCRLGHGAGDPPEILHGKALFQDEPGTHDQGLSPADGKIVDRPVDGKRPDVAAGEEDRVDDIGIGGETQQLIAHPQDGTVLEPLQAGVFQKRQEDLRDQFVAQKPTATVFQKNPIVLHF